MNISDEQLDRMIEAAKNEVGEMNNMLDIVTDTRNHDYYGRRLADAATLLHILETYRDLPNTADGVRVVPGQKVWVITADDGIQEDEITSELCFYNAHPIDKTFSTREAAEAAKASGK
jgi:hypothetical protein